MDRHTVFILLSTQDVSIDQKNMLHYNRRETGMAFQMTQEKTPKANLAEYTRMKELV